MTSTSQLKLFTGNANPKLAMAIADYIGVPLGQSSIKTFADGEIKLEINESVRGMDVFIVQPTCAPVNDNLMELLIMVDAMRRASARRVTAIIPYYGYARQERKSKSRDPISAKLVANLICAAGTKRVLGIDLHASAIQGFFDIPFDHLLAAPVLAENYITQHHDLGDIVVTSPDVGGIARARSMAKRLGCGLAIIDKRRPEPNKSEIMNIIGDVKDKTVIMLDDIIDTAGTITQGANALVERGGAKRVLACCTHPVFTPPAIERINNSYIEEVLVTDTIPLRPEVQGHSDKIKVASIAPLLGEAVMRIHSDRSVSYLFKD